ncbi:MAG: hypothetical protein ACUVUD_05430 [bacterium]
MTFDAEYELTKIAPYVPRPLKARKLGLEPVGIAFHVGSQCTYGNNYLEAMELARIILVEAEHKGLNLTIVNIGGGFPISYSDSAEDLFSDIAPAIGLELPRMFGPEIRIIAEPGRVIIGTAAILVISIIGKSICNNKHCYYLDDGVYGTLSGIIFDYCKYHFESLKKGPTQLTTLAGLTCDSIDIISSAEELPELELGDIILPVISVLTPSRMPPVSTVFLPPKRLSFHKEAT